MFEGRLIRQKDSIIQLIISDSTVVVGETHTRQEFKFKEMHTQDITTKIVDRTNNSRANMTLKIDPVLNK
jgi:hypothetical protein